MEDALIILIKIKKYGALSLSLSETVDCVKVIFHKNTLFSYD
jgi:hypothetical protein